MALILAGCGRRGTGIMDVSTTSDPRVLELGTSECHAEPRARAEETDDVVTLWVTQKRTIRFANQNACAGLVRVQLRDPLGDRQLVDGIDGSELEITD